uniref:Peptidase metallopeptidase domain-containing protein n=1 Tax=Sus scrofa TaxID=9823 RepID=A0A8D0RAC6_PIG
MAARVGLLLRTLPLLLWGGLDAQLAQRVGQELRREAEAFLEKYGYLNEQVPQSPTSSLRFSKAIREFQWVSQLPISGVLDPATLRQMMRPRCGVADTNSQAPWTERVSALFAGHQTKMRRKKRFARQGTKWYKQHLSYRLVNWPQHLPEPAVRGAVRAAFQLWSNVSALEFWEAPATGPADIRLTFFQGDHNDGLSNAFDGPGGALAHAFLPRRGEAHFDRDERWSLSRRRGRNLFVVLAHEIGHTLGLTHSAAPRALMAPYYKRLGRDALLSWDDVLAVQNLYGNSDCTFFKGTSSGRWPRTATSQSPAHYRKGGRGFRPTLRLQPCPWRRETSTSSKGVAAGGSGAPSQCGAPRSCAGQGVCPATPTQPSSSLL